MAERKKGPTYQFIKGHFYCDGVKVFPSQMTVDEIEKYIPKDYQQTYLNAITRAPIRSATDDKK